MRKYLTILLVLILAVVIVLWPLEVANGAQINKALLLNVSGAIGPASSDYLQQGIKEAEKQNSMVIIQLDTPGGLAESMHDINKKILSSSVPIIVYVAPSGARAASAGTYILYASHIAAMAPGTHLGAATPVNVGSGFPDPQKEKSNIPKNNEQNTLTKKITLDAIAYLRSLAQLRGRNLEFAEQSIKDGTTLTATEAKQKQVIDIIAVDLADLMKQLNGRSVRVQEHETILNTQDITIVPFEASWRIKLLMVITNPNIAYMLFLIGIYGLFFEFVNPGFVVPGIVGGIALILGLYALQMLPINYAGLALMILGIIFMVAEAFVPSGALGIGGIFSFIAGSVLLLDPTTSGIQIAWSLIFAMALTNALIFFVVASIGIKAHRLKPISGVDTMINLEGVALEDIDLIGQAKIQGEIWQVRSKLPIKKGETLCVVAVNGLELEVAKKKVQ